MTQAANITIASNQALESLAGLENVRSKLDYLGVYGNPALASLRALESTLPAAAAGIYQNATLPQCEVSWLGELWQLEIESYANDGAESCGD